ncbi:MAG: MBL fold metallo-hydrolase [Actinomycetota bacterium]
MLSSGSDGNATLVGSGDSSLLIDAGLSLIELTRRMEIARTGPYALDAVLISHDHYDHVKGAVPLCRRTGVPLYASRATIKASGLTRALPAEQVRELRPDTPFEVAGLTVTPFAVPHDTFTVGFTISDGEATVGLATDLGSVTLDVLSHLAGCDVLVLESNHDEDMLERGPYPPHLKRRIGSPLGHLSNADTAELVRSLGHPGLRHLVLAHLSRTNNRPELPLQAAGEALGECGGEVSVSLGWHDHPGELIVV